MLVTYFKYCSYLKVSASAKVSAICSIGIGEYLAIGIDGNFSIGAALVLNSRKMIDRSGAGSM